MGSTVALALVGPLALPFIASDNASKKAERKAESAARDAEERNRLLEAQAKARGEDEESLSTEISVRDKARNRQKARAAAASGRRDTFITGPLGVKGDSIATGGKKALGV